MGLTLELALDRLAKSKILRCPECGSPLGCAGDAVFRCEFGHETTPRHGVLDLYAPPPAHGSCKADESAHASVVSALSDRLGLTSSALESVQLFEPLPPTGNAFFDAEENIFLDRFAFSNALPRLKLQRVYSNGRMQAGVVNWLAVRVKNDSPFPIASTGANPVLLSYHWFDSNGVIRHFEGLRSPLPVDLKPGQAVTAHVAVHAPNEADRLLLQILPVHELVAWLEDGAVTLEIDVTPDPPGSLPSLDRGRAFHESVDDELSEAFLGKHLAACESLFGLEIGGGIMPALSKWIWSRGKQAIVINGDISLRLLRIAALLSAKGADPVTVHARFDANHLPIMSNTLDAVVFCRSLHHFEDPIAAMRECRRVLKPQGLLFLLCEPVSVQYDEPTKALIRAGVNEQMFPYEAYEAMIKHAGFACIDAACDWGFSLKAALRKAD